MEELLINSGMRETRAVILVDGVLEDIWIERLTVGPKLGDAFAQRFPKRLVFNALADADVMVRLHHPHQRRRRGDR